jgi:predicted small lipoprotein YifL
MERRERKGERKRKLDFLAEVLVGHATVMLKRTLIVATRVVVAVVAAAALSCGLSACGKKSPEEIRKEKVEALKVKKRENAKTFYEKLAKEFPESPKRAEAEERAAALGSSKNK